MPDELFDHLHLFQDVSPSQREILRSLFTPIHLDCEDVVFDQGEPAEFLYLLIEGEVMVRFKPDDGSEITVARVKPEGVVGWSAALGSPAYTSAAVCSTACQMLRVSSQAMRELYHRDPETGCLLLERLAIIIAQRLRNTHTHVIALLEQGLSLSIRNH